MQSLVDMFKAKTAAGKDPERIPIAHQMTSQTSNGFTLDGLGGDRKSSTASITASGYQGNEQPMKAQQPGGVEKPSITAWDAGWNVSNATQGLFVLGLPYAILHGGYHGLVLIVLTALVCYYTGNLLISCLYEQDLNGDLVRVRSTYVDVATACMGRRLGSSIVNVSQLIELLMTCVLYVVVSGNLMANSFPKAPIAETGWSVMAAILLLFCIFLRDLKAVSRLSMGCSIAQIVVMVVTLIYCLSKIKTWAWRKISFSVDSEFPVSIGVIVFSYTSQIFLPSLEGSMERRDQFKPMLYWSYVVSCIIKALFAMMCFLTWADDTKDVVTDNLPSALRAIVNVVLVIKALLSYPLPYYSSVEVLEQQFFTNATGGWGSLFGTKRNAYSSFSQATSPISQSTSFVTSPEDGEEESRKRFHSISVSLGDNNDPGGFPSCYNATGHVQPWALLLRSSLVLGTLLMGVFIPHFALLMGLTGSLTGTALAFLLPCAFHTKLKWNELKWRQIALNVAIFLMGVLFAVTGIYYSILALYDVYNPTTLNAPPMNGTITNRTHSDPQWFPAFPNNHKKLFRF